MARKIKVGDWVIVNRAGYHNAFPVDKVSDSGDEVHGDSGWWPARHCRRLPTSPAVLAKSHRLLMRFWKTRHSGASQFDVERFIYAHCRRIAKGKGKK